MLAPGRAAAEDPEPKAQAAEGAKAAPGERREARQKVREAMREGRRDERQKLQTARGEAREEISEARREAREAVREAHAKLREARAQAGEDRTQRRRAARAARWKSLRDRIRAAPRGRVPAGEPSAAAAQVPPEVRAELLVHARRMARIDRVAAVAGKRGDEKALKRIDAVREKEGARHAARMAELLDPTTAEPAAALEDEAEHDQEAQADDEEQPDEEDEP
jgi:hypothetical protein